MLDWGRTVVGRDPTAREPEMSSLFLGAVVPIPTLLLIWYRLEID
jgi:hypothetical protein